MLEFREKKTDEAGLKRLRCSRHFIRLDEMGEMPMRQDYF